MLAGEKHANSPKFINIVIKAFEFVQGDKESPDFGVCLDCSVFHAESWFCLDCASAG